MKTQALRIGVSLTALCLAAGNLALAAESVRPDIPSASQCGSASAAQRLERYELTANRSGSWTGINDRYRLRVEFTGEGVRVTPLDETCLGWEWSMSLRREGPPGTPRDVEAAFPLLYGNRIDLTRASSTEWFINGPKGLQHGFDLPATAVPGIMHLDFAVGGTLASKIAGDGQSISFLDSRGAPVLAYRDLHASDAEGREVAVRWESIRATEGSPAGLRVVIEGGEHVYPVRVQGLIVPPKQVRESSSLADVPSPAASGPLAAPGNDLCSGAEVIPASGPFPYTSGAYDITDATTTGDPPAPSCPVVQPPNVSRSIWFAFTPSATALYTFSLCSDAPTLTTVEDTVMAIYSATGTCTGLSELTGGCDDDSCVAGDLQSVISGLQLNAATTYYIVAWMFGTTAPAPGSATIQLRVSKDSLPPSAPPNDQCSGAAVIPAGGPFPYLTPLIADISGATTGGDPPAPSCQPNVSRSVWYSFTPSTSASYTFSVCSDAPTGTTVDDTVMAIYSSSGVCSGLSEMPGGCDDDSCVVEDAQSVLGGITLSAGNTYYIVVWKFDTPPPSQNNTAVQMRVSQVLGPGNDRCGGAIPLATDSPAAGTTAGTINDYQLPSASACFSGVGQTASTAPGSEVVYKFTAPRASSYSFRVTGYASTGNLVLYAASDCPAGPYPATVAGCLGAANRSSSGSAEEVKCLAMTANQAVYVYVDENSATAGSDFTIEVNECFNETESNGTTATANDLSCGIEGSITPTTDVEFFNLGIPVSGSRVFAMIDGVASNDTDFDLRVTTSTDTLEYDDADNVLAFGTNSPNIAGTPLTGVASYLRVNHFRATTQAEPYRVYHAVQPPSSSATAEVEPNNSIGSATPGANLYFSGALSATTDVDIFSFAASAGEILEIGLDLDPTRDNTPFNGTLELLDGTGASIVLVNDSDAISSTTPGTGSLTATTPKSPGEALTYRIRTSGTYYAKVSTSSGAIGDYLLSISRNCKISPPTDLGVTQTDSPDPVSPSANVTYTVTVRNLGTAPASVVVLRDDLPPGSVFVSATPSQGTCTGSGPVVCHLGTIAGSGLATVAVVVTAPASPGTITNTARGTTMVIDTNPSNDTSSETTTVGSADSDNDGVPDAQDCAPLDGTAWAVPGEATGLRFPTPGDKTFMQWTAPAAPGGTVVNYDLLRSTTASDFSAPTCVASNITATSATDAATPSPRFYYLVRAENVCGGNLGNRSNGTPRTGGSCP